jgi:hypothetical protein
MSKKKSYFHSILRDLYLGDTRMLIAHHDPSWIIVDAMLVMAVGIALISVMFNLHDRKGDPK